MRKIAAGIVTFNPDIARLEENVSAIIEQVEQLIIVDNGSDNVQQLKEKWNNQEKIHIIENDDNMGIATALNQMLAFSSELGFSWTLTLDGDSVVPANMVAEYEKYMEMPDVAMIVPVIYDRIMHEIDIHEIITDEYSYVENAITSGTLMNNKIWDEVGRFTEKLFIDYVDFDYCMKVRLANYKILRVNSVKLLHELGNATEIKFFTKMAKICKSGSKWERRFNELKYTTNHSPKRLYYVTRNQYYYIRTYGEYFDAKRLIRGMKIGWVVKLIFEKDRLRKLKAICCGIKDGKRL